MNTHLVEWPVSGGQALSSTPSLGGLQTALVEEGPESFQDFEQAPMGIVIVRGEFHRVVYANPSFLKLTGLKGSAIVGQGTAGIIKDLPSHISDLVALLDSVRNEHVIALDVNAAGHGEGAVEARAHIGTQDTWRCTVWPGRECGMEVDHLVVEIRHSREGTSSLARQRDITERMLLSALREQALCEENTRLRGLADSARIAAQEAQQHAERQQRRAEDAQHQAEAANSTKAQFLANMSHELRTPLNAIGGYAQLMEMGLRGAVTDQQVQDLQRIQRSQAHLLGLINSILNYAKLEAGSVVYEMEDVEIGDVMSEVESLVGPQLRAKGLWYNYAPCVGDGRIIHAQVKADAEKLRQVLINLLTNAIKFTADGGHIDVTCSTENGKALLSVSDTGRGIPANEIRTIFDPFVQVGSRLAPGSTGVGLGLAISRDLALGMGGDLRVESVEGEGSTFTLTMPMGCP